MSDQGPYSQQGQQGQQPPGNGSGNAPGAYPGGYPQQPQQQQWGPPQQQQWVPPPQQQWVPPPQQQWGPPPRPVNRMPTFPHPDPREYHQMLRTWNYAWWKPVVGMLIVVLAMIIVAPLLLLPVLAIGVGFGDGPFWESFERAASFETVGPASLLYLNLVLGSTILITWFVMRVLHRMRPRWLASVVPKLRWKFFFICVGLSVVALIAQLVVGMLLPGSQEADFGAVNDFTRSSIILAVVVLLTTPLQAAGEEYVFRGYLMQALGSLFRSKWVAILATATLFAAAHGVQNFPLFFDRFMFGLIAGWLVVRTGGLEVGIAMHILNNFLAFGFAISFGDLTESLNVSEVGWSNIILTLTQAITYAVLVLLVARKMNLQTRTNPPPQQAENSAPYDVAPASRSA